MPAEADSDARVRATYDAVAEEYDRSLADELDGKPLDRALLTAFVELVGEGIIADLGCGPGHVTRFLAAQHADVIGLDLSPRMIDIARSKASDLSFSVASLLELPADDSAWAGAIALYSIIHMSSSERRTAFSEIGRVLRRGGHVLVAFHVDSAEFRVGDTNHLTDWFGQHVDIEGHFLAPDRITDELEAAGLEVVGSLVRRPAPEVEYPSRRCYLLARRP